MASTTTPSSYPSTDLVIAAAKAVARALRDSNVKYAVVGGTSCLLLGSHRVTTDVDIVVPKGRVRDARLLLKAQPEHFSVDPRTNHTVYLSTPPIDIQIIAPPALFKEPFDDSTETIELMDGVWVLKPTLILNAKCRAILGRAGESKKTSDAQDIKFLLHWCAENGMRVNTAEVPNATTEFVGAFTAMYGGEELWERAGYGMPG
jgi:predicted nucleotidyltransferase